jgi:hypothetical protein
VGCEEEWAWAAAAPSVLAWAWEAAAPSVLAWAWEAAALCPAEEAQTHGAAAVDGHGAPVDRVNDAVVVTHERERDDLCEGFSDGGGGGTGEGAVSWGTNNKTKRNSIPTMLQAALCTQNNAVMAKDGASCTRPRKAWRCRPR